MTSLLAIDPGPTESAFVRMVDSKITEHGKIPNEAMLQCVTDNNVKPLAIEMIGSYGMPVGAEVFETCVWIGRFIQVANHAERMLRREVKLHLCQSARANDAAIRQRLIDIYSDGQGKEFAVGRKKSPGPLFGITIDKWQALALGVTYGELKLGWKIQ